MNIGKTIRVKLGISSLSDAHNSNVPVSCPPNSAKVVSASDFSGSKGGGRTDKTLFVKVCLTYVEK
jgi:hypothetical protein